jgi:hypothetical protein
VSASVKSRRELQAAVQRLVTLSAPVVADYRAVAVALSRVMSEDAEEQIEVVLHVKVTEQALLP